MTILILAILTGFSIGWPMNTGDNNLRQLADILAGAYGNALGHGTARAGLEAQDLLLESASIQFSSRVIYEITEGSCRRDEHGVGDSADHTCVLDDESIALRSLTDMLSYAASRLENLSRSAPADRTASQSALVLARIGSMEHLYRMAFALSMMYLDRPQSGVYLEAARGQLRLARRQMEIERQLCACSEHEQAAGSLSRLEDQLKGIPDDAARP
ncbi:MAG: hypothetical protein WB566_20580 [Terriglobales bacterium]